MKYLLCSSLLLLSQFATAEEEFRTDGGNAKLPWYQLKPGEFPPEGSAHYISGELIQIKHVRREFAIRVDRTDAQNRSHWDLPLAAKMLPFGSIYYHGAPAALEDIPLGTHLHGLFYLKDPDDRSSPLEGWHRRTTPEKDFTRCFRLEDDFSHYARNGFTWKVDSVDLNELKLVATLTTSEKQGSQATFDLSRSTRMWKGHGIGQLDDLKAGEEVQFNITWATLYGPGRIRELWLDEASRRLAKAHQRDKHIEHVRLRGLPGWVDEVDNQRRIVTITLFGGIDSELLESVKKGSSAGLAVAMESLATYDPVNDRKSGPVLEVVSAKSEPGSSGIQIQVQPSLLLEGYRPGHIVRVYPSDWPVIALPREEQMFGQE